MRPTYAGCGATKGGGGGAPAGKPPSSWALPDEDEGHEARAADACGGLGGLDSDDGSDVSGDDDAGPGDHRCCAFALVPLPEGPPPCEADFRAPLSLSGHARGTLVGRVSLSRPRGRSRSQPGKPGARERNVTLVVNVQKGTNLKGPKELAPDYELLWATESVRRGREGARMRTSRPRAGRHADDTT